MLAKTEVEIATNQLLDAMDDVAFVDGDTSSDRGVHTCSHVDAADVHTNSGLTAHQTTNNKLQRGNNGC